jgi:hypothetical protein
MRLCDWQLRVLAGGASGGSIEQAIPAAAAIACLRISIILVDDLLDADPRGEHHRVGAPTTANLASHFLVLASMLLLGARQTGQPRRTRCGALIV